MGKTRDILTRRSYGLTQVIFSRCFYAIKLVHNKWNNYWTLKRSIELDAESKIGIHHSTLFNIYNSKIIVRKGSLKIGIDFGYFDGGIYDPRKDNCRIYLVNSTLEIEGNVSLYPGVIISAINAKVVIKNGTIINGGSHVIALKGVEIGEDCLLAQGVMIRDNDGHKLGDSVDKELVMGIDKVVIGNHCWLGQKAMILKGVTLQDNVVVAGGAVVSKSVEAGNIVAGVPAKTIKEKINWA